MPYKSLQPVLILPRIFYTIIIDFILTLPALLSRLNIIFIAIYKFSKKVIIVLGKDI